MDNKLMKELFMRGWWSATFAMYDMLESDMPQFVDLMEAVSLLDVNDRDAFVASEIRIELEGKGKGK